MKAGKRPAFTNPHLERRVEHIAETARADFVRGHTTPETTTAIEPQLATGRAACADGATLWKSHQKVAAREQEYTPQPQAVRLVEAQLAAARVAAPTAPGLATL